MGREGEFHMTIGALLSWASGTWLGRAVAGALALLVAILAAWGAGRVGGKRSARTEARDEDYEHADDIRRRVERGADDRVRKHDDAGWRD